MPARLNGVLMMSVVLVVMAGGAGLVIQPALPASFYGTVTLDGADVPVGTSVSARIKGVQYAETMVILFEDRPFYTIDVPADDPDTTEVEGGRLGDTVVFYVDGWPAKPTAVWQAGTNTALDLTATSVTTQTHVVHLPLVRRP